MKKTSVTAFHKSEDILDFKNSLNKDKVKFVAMFYSHIQGYLTSGPKKENVEFCYYLLPTFTGNLTKNLS